MNTQVQSRLKEDPADRCPFVGEYAGSNLPWYDRCCLPAGHGGLHRGQGLEDLHPVPA